MYRHVIQHQEGVGLSFNKTLLENPITSRNIVESPMRQKVIRAYLDTTKTSWTLRDLTAHIKAKVGLLLPERTVRNIMMKVLKMRYKKDFRDLSTLMRGANYE